MIVILTCAVAPLRSRANAREACRPVFPVPLYSWQIHFSARQLPAAHHHARLHPLIKYQSPIYGMMVDAPLPDGIPRLLHDIDEQDDPSRPDAQLPEKDCITFDVSRADTKIILTTSPKVDTTSHFEPSAERNHPKTG
jgi:hypothetical protein